MRKTARRAVTIIILLYLMFTLSRSFFMGPEGALKRIFEYAKKYDQTGVEVCINNDIKRRVDLRDSIFRVADREIHDMEIIGVTYNDAHNLAVVDMVVDKTRADGSRGKARNLFFMCYEPGLDWNLYGIAGYSKINLARSQCPSVQKQVDGVKQAIGEGQTASIGGSSGYTEGSSGYTGGNNGYTEGNSGYTGGNNGYTEGNNGYTGGNDGYTEGNSGYTDGNNGTGAQPGTAMYYLGREITDRELCGLAQTYYYNHNDIMPPYAEIEGWDGDVALIHLYEDMGDHQATWDWFSVSRIDGKGTDFMGNYVDIFEIFQQ